MKNQKFSVWLAFVICVVWAGSASGFKTKFYETFGAGIGKSIHEDITREALGSIRVVFPDGTTGKIREEFITYLAEENNENDERGLDHGELHFDDSRLVESAQQVWNAKEAALKAFKSGNNEQKNTADIWQDGPPVQTNLGSAMHTIQDFFAHSTWAETNIYLKSQTKEMVPPPKLGIIEKPFEDALFLAHTGIQILDNPTHEFRAIDGGCAENGFNPSIMKISSAYYDYQMSDLGVQGTIDYGFYTDGWNSKSKSAALGFKDKAPVRVPTTYFIDWPLKRCVHGGDGENTREAKYSGLNRGINKDAADRYGHKEARAAAVRATTEFMLNFLAEAKALSNENRKKSCSYILECDPGSSNTDTGAGSTSSGSAITSIVPGPLLFNADVLPAGGPDSTHLRSGVTHKILSLFTNVEFRGMVQVKFKREPCEFLEWNGFGERFICPTSHAGPGTLEIFQTANPDDIKKSLTVVVMDTPPPPVPTVTALSPMTASVGEVKTFSITGSNLPTSTNLDITLTGCSNLVFGTKSATLHTFSCTVGNVSTMRAVVRAVARGAELGAFDVAVSAPVGSLALNETFNGTTTVDLAKWTVDGFGLGQIGTVSVSGGLAQFGAFGRISTTGKVNFTGSKIVIEARMGGTGGSRDTSILLKDASNTSNTIYSGDTNYCGWGMHASASGIFELTTGAFECGGANKVRHVGVSTNQLMEYRWTLQGNQMLVERGATLATITDSMTITLGQSIAGKSFNLSIGTASASYSPGTWDWVTVTTTP